METPLSAPRHMVSTGSQSDFYSKWMQGTNFWGLRTAAPPSQRVQASAPARDTDVCDGSWSACKRAHTHLNSPPLDVMRSVIRTCLQAHIWRNACVALPKSNSAQQDSFRLFTYITKPGELCGTCAFQCGAVARRESGRPALKDKQSRAKLREEGRERPQSSPHTSTDGLAVFLKPTRHRIRRWKNVVPRWTASVGIIYCRAASWLIAQQCRSMD